MKMATAGQHLQRYPALCRCGALIGLGLMLLAGPVAAAERLIVTNSYVAEIVVALGGASQIVAVGGGSDHLSELAKVPRLPGFRQTSAEPRNGSSRPAIAR